MRGSASFFNYLFKASLSSGGKVALPKTPVTASTIVEMVMERVVSIDIIVITCSRNKVRILSPEDYLYQGPFQWFV